MFKQDGDKTELRQCKGVYWISKTPYILAKIIKHIKTRQ